MSDVDYFEPSSEEHPDYILTESTSVDAAVSRLNTSLEEFSKLLSPLDTKTQGIVYNAFQDALEVYAENQTTAKNIITKYCKDTLSVNLQGELLDCVMFVRSRMNGVEQVIQDDPELASFYVQQVLNNIFSDI